MNQSNAQRAASRPALSRGSLFCLQRLQSLGACLVSLVWNARKRTRDVLVTRGTDTFDVALEENGSAQ